MKSNNLADRLIVALDVATATEAIALMDQLPQVSFWKVGLQLFISDGPTILKVLKERQKRVFLDLKLHDIPNTVAGDCKSVLDYEVDLLTIHATAGKQALKEAVAAVAGHEVRQNLIGITVLTSIDSRALALELKIPLELPEYALNMALLCQESGLDGAVCSPHEVAQLRETCGDDFLLVCPGVRPSWAEAKDQKRVMTPAEAFKAGADYLVIGRPINAAPNPQFAWDRICGELK